ncbi:hypothetical protein GOP47_0024301 [Adiantum capillus-veneris]|uniref:Uncharacterized protein n=1 Tax=Adiantum capillus-veneris TaxID=13818 RepID=A0A9D4U484_ADICA|nr:hypothetical protein GOP47_0024301 [Adiantum capillus-veneris]
MAPNKKSSRASARDELVDGHAAVLLHFEVGADEAVRPRHLIGGGAQEIAEKGVTSDYGKTCGVHSGSKMGWSSYSKHGWQVGH